MASQFVLASGSNPFFEPDIWIRTGPEQYIKNKPIAFLPDEELTDENDAIQNNFGEYENRHAISKYDPIWYDTTDSDKNESYSSDENDEYTKPTCNNVYPDVGVGYALFVDHNEGRPINEPVEACHFQKFYGNETNYEPLEVNPHRMDMRRV